MLKIGLNYQQPRTPPPAPCINTSYEARYGGSSRAITSPLSFILHKTTFSCSSLPTLSIALERTRGQKKKQLNHPTKHVSCFTRPCLRLHILTLARALHWYRLVSVRFCSVAVPCHRHGFTIRFYAFWVTIRFHRQGPSIHSSFS